VPRIVFGRNKEELYEQVTVSYLEEFRDLYESHNIVRILIQEATMRMWQGQFDRNIC
jgi:hypothetical protein